MFVGVYIHLNGTNYPNDSDILITDVGGGDAGALQCISDLTECCKNSHTVSDRALGEWFYPNRTDVGLKSKKETFYKNRDHRTVYLHRRMGSMSPIGKFCCEVPDATYTNITICVNLGEYYNFRLRPSS